MSVKIVSFKSSLILPRIRNPSFSPGPRNAFTEERFALSNEALKTYGTPASAAIVATRSAIIRACPSDSITHGPAIRKSELPAPIAIGLIFISFDSLIALLTISHASLRPLGRNDVKPPLAIDSVGSKIILVYGENSGKGFPRCQVHQRRIGKVHGQI